MIFSPNLPYRAMKAMDLKTLKKGANKYYFLFLMSQKFGI